MKESLDFRARQHKLEDVLFSSIRLKIPRYQRPYSWGDDQLSEFWNDLANGE